MNSVRIVFCVLFALAVLPASTVLGVLATAAGSLFEGAPFILAGLALRALLSRTPHLPHRLAAVIGSYLGCGCGTGPTARSVPATIAAAMSFGAPLAILRLAAASLVARFVTRCDERTDSTTLLGQLAALAPAAVAGGVVLNAFGDVRLERLPPLLQLAGGCVAGFLSAPCGLGAVAVAASLHVRAPLAALGFLSTGGLFDLRTLVRRLHAGASNDACAYATAAVALGVVALRGGDSLVHPRFAIALGLCAVACAALAYVHRRAACPRARVAPAIMLAGALLGAPAPSYVVTETTLADLFPGERVTFTGQLVRGSDADALVRFAITCCRADATPVVLRLARRVRMPVRLWLHADGTIERSGNDLRLDASRVRAVAPPADPFIYR